MSDTVPAKSRLACTEPTAMGASRWTLASLRKRPHITGAAPPPGYQHTAALLHTNCHPTVATQSVPHTATQRNATPPKTAHHTAEHHLVL